MAGGGRRRLSDISIAATTMPPLWSINTVAMLRDDYCSGLCRCARQRLRRAGMYLLGSIRCRSRPLRVSMGIVLPFLSKAQLDAIGADAIEQAVVEAIRTGDDRAALVMAAGPLLTRCRDRYGFVVVRDGLPPDDTVLADSLVTLSRALSRLDPIIGRRIPTPLLPGRGADRSEGPDLSRVVEARRAPTRHRRYPPRSRARCRWLCQRSLQAAAAAGR